MNTPMNTQTAPAPRSEASSHGEPSLLRTVLGERKFLVLVAVLVVAAAGLNVSVKALQLHFKKEPVPMRMAFGTALPRVMGDWVQVGKRDALESDLLLSLGTDQFLFCNYIDARALGRNADAIMREFDGKPADKQAELVRKYRMQNPLAVMDLSLTYYTGKADTVAHVPERCYVAGGYDPVDPQTETWNCDGRRLDVRHIRFMNQSSAVTAEPVNVAYFFNTNGGYEANSLLVRATLQDLFARHGYYAKVELMSVSAERDRSRAAMERFLGTALPHIEKALPDWNQYKDQSKAGKAAKSG